MINARVATVSDVDSLEPLVAEYHQFEDINSSIEIRRDALLKLTNPGNNYGFIVVATSDESIFGYAAICFGFSIEFGGRDAFLDELFVEESARRNGVGEKLIKLSGKIATEAKIKALHLEVSNSNEKAKNFYRRLGFANREKFHLMSKTLPD